jgi:hypothetical protein
MSEGTSPVSGSATVTSGGERASSAPRKAAMSVCRVTGRPTSLSATKPVSSRQNTSYSSTMRIPCERKKPTVNLKDVRIAIRAVASLLYNLYKKRTARRPRARAGGRSLFPGRRVQSVKRCPARTTDDSRGPFQAMLKVKVLTLTLDLRRRAIAVE